MIVSGEKKEEYREIKDYYDSRLLNAFCAIRVGDEELHNALPEADWVEWPVPIVFRNGYSAASRQIKAMCTLSIGTGKPECEDCMSTHKVSVYIDFTEPVSYREAEQYVADLIYHGQRELEKGSSRFAVRYMKNKCAAK